MTFLLRKLASAIYDRLWRAPRGLGRPISSSAWDINFEAGNWKHLSDLSETSRYAVVHNYAVQLISPAKILDIGAGTGVLRSFFSEAEIVRYIGLDISSVAVRLCDAQHFPFSTFLAADFDEYEPEPESDIVIFNESIGYATDPGETFRKYWSVLNRGKVCIISMHEYDMRSRAAWSRIERHASPRYSIRLTNEKGQSWDIKVFIKT